MHYRSATRSPECFDYLININECGSNMTKIEAELKITLEWVKVQQFLVYIYIINKDLLSKT